MLALRSTTSRTATSSAWTADAFGWPMAKRAAGRRQQRIAKRQAAKETRDTKYANQKGAISKKSRKVRAERDVGDHLEDDGEDMAVVRAGKAVWSRSTEPDPNAQPDPEEDEDEGEQRFTPSEKKLRALKKKLRKLDFIKQRRKKGFELDPKQLASLRTEGVLLAQISVFEKEVAAEAAQAAEEDDEDDEDDEDVDRAGAGTKRASLSGLSLQERRALKKQRHQAKLDAKAKKLEAKKGGIRKH